MVSQLLCMVCFSCLLSKAAHSVLGCVPGVITACTCVDLIFLMGVLRSVSSFTTATLDLLQNYLGDGVFEQEPLFGSLLFCAPGLFGAVYHTAFPSLL